MGGLFSSKKKKKVEKKNHVNEKDKAILELKRQRDRLRKYKVKIQSVMERETGIAKQLLKQGKKKLALLALKKKKYQAGLLEKTESQLLNLEDMVNSIEFATVQQEVFKALETGKDTLQRINSETSIEDAELLMQETEEAIAYQDEMSRILGAELSAVDNEEIEKEYAMLQELEADTQSLEMPSVPEKELNQDQEQQVDAVEEKSKPAVVMA